MRGRFAVWAAVWGLSLVLAGQAHADGVAYESDPLSPFDRSPQDEQIAAIVHRDGIEKLVIAINIDLEKDERALWIFPVPGTPDRVRLDVLDTFPEFSGKNLRGQAERAIDCVTAVMAATQIYPVIVPFFYFAHAGGSSDSASVSVQQTIDKYGVHAEAVSADSLEALSEYLAANGAAIAGEDLRAFEPYLLREYALILAWIASREELISEFPGVQDGRWDSSQRWPCLYAEFPTERAFYPLRPTSAYGRKWIEISVYVVGFVTLDVEDPEWAEEHFGVAYCRQDGFGPNAPEEFTEGLPDGPVRYTVVHDRSLTADQLTSDLWFRPHEPASVKYASVMAILLRPYVFAPFCALLIAGLSYVSAGISALLVYDEWRPYARRGVWNVLTLIGLGYAVAKYHQRDVGEKRDLVPFLLVFALIYALLAFAARAVLLAPLA